MQSREARSDPSRGIVIPHASSALILLWLFLHRHLLVFFSTSLQGCWWSWNGWCWNEHKRWFQSQRVKFPFVSMSASCVLDLDLGSKLILSNNQSRATLWVLETCLNVRASSLYDHLDHCFIVFKDVQQSFLTRRIHVRGNKSTLSRSSIFPRIFFRAGDVDKSPCTCSLWFVSPWRTATIRSHKSSAGFPTNNCVQGNDLLFCWTVRNWSLFLAHSSYWNKCMTSKNAVFLQKWILNPQDLLQNQSLETIPICIVLQCFPHDNIVCVHLYDECKRSNDKIVGHMFWSILWLIVQICFLAIEYQVFQYVPNISISKQFESIVLTSLPRISILLLKNDGRQGMELILCRVVESSCLPTHNIVPHISWHDPSEHGNFQLLLRKYWTQTWFWNCQHCLCLCHSIFEYIPGKHGQGMMLVLPNRLLCLTLSTSV